MQKKIRQIMKRRAAFLFIIFILAFMFLTYRLIQINVVDGENYKNAVIAQQIRNQTDSNLEIVAKRGTIYDRNGIALAESIRVYNVVFNPGLLSTLKIEAQQDAAQLLSDTLGLSYSDLIQRIIDKPYSFYEVVSREMSYESIATIEEAINNKTVVGVTLEEYFKRSYPYNTLAADVIGFLSRDGRGLYGLEAYYDKILTGQNGRSFGSIDDGYMINQEVIDPINGQNIYLNLDFTLQKLVEDTIGNYFQNKIEGGVSVAAEGVTIILMDPRNAKVLALAEYPTYNLNDPYNMTHLMDESEFAELEQVEKQKIREGIWDNRVIRDNYEPGSTFKPMTFSMALEENAVDPKTVTYTCTGSHVPYPGVAPVRCWKTEGHGVQTYDEALANSCNVAFMQIGISVGKGDFFEYQRMFGFGAITGIDLAGEYSMREALHTFEGLGPVELAISAFGQTFEVSPIQLITAFSSVINGGVLYTPQVVQKIVTQEGQLISSKTPEIIRQVISKETAEATKDALAFAVEQGTGQTAQIEGYTIGGKTGTAEILPRGSSEFIVSFIGFAPVENPEVVALVIVDKPKGVNYDNSAHARGIFVDLMTEALPYLGVRRDFGDVIVDNVEPIDEAADEAADEPIDAGENNEENND